MDPALPALTQDEIDRLEADGLKPYEYKPLPDRINPFHPVCKINASPKPLFHVRFDDEKENKILQFMPS